MFTKPGLFTVLVMILILSMAACASPSPSPQIARKASPFTLKTMDGDSVSLDALKGRLILINFWSTTCPPCIEEMPYFEDLQQDWRNRDDFKLLMINTGESAAVISNFLKNHSYTFTVLLDEGFKVGQKYAIRYTPTTLVIDKNGMIKASIVGPFKNKAAIEKMVTPYLFE